MSEHTWSGCAFYDIGKNGQIFWQSFYIHVAWFGDEIRLWFDRQGLVIRGQCGVFREIPEGELADVCTTVGIKSKYFDILKRKALEEIIRKNEDTIDELITFNRNYREEIRKLRN